MATPRLLERSDVLRQLADLPGWQFFGAALHARYDAPDVPAALALVGDAFEVAEELNHHPDTDIRWKRVRFSLSTHEAGGVTHRDFELAHRIAAAAAARAAALTELTPTLLEVGIDTSQPEVIAGVWAAALDCTVVADEAGTVGLRPAGGGPPAVWFQRTDSPAPGRNRLHIDISVQPDEAARRREALDAAGARLVTAQFAPAWWVYTDQDGNEVCVCTEEGRDDG